MHPVVQVLQWAGERRPSRWVLWTAAVVVTAVVGMVAVSFAMVTSLSASQRLLFAAAGQAPTRQCASPVVSLSDPSGSQWGGEQRANAQAIVAQGRETQVPARGWVIAVATAMQESTLRNLPYGDAPGYLGLFQQYVTWGPESVRMDPKGAAGLFYQRLTALNGWEQMPLARAAQSVQISAFPDAYAKWEDDAQRLVAEVTEGQGDVWCTGASVDGWHLPLNADDIHPPMRPHHDYAAVDIGVPVGQPVFAMRGGTVTEIRGGACGYGMAVTDTEGAEWIYCHASMLATVGGSVTAGQEIMRSGGAPGTAGAGSSTGPHLHMQVRFGGVMRCVGTAVDQLAAGQTPSPVAQWATSGCSY